MFIQPSEINAVYLHIDQIDFRKGINGLGCEVTMSFGDSSSGKNLFVFLTVSQIPPTTALA